MTATEQFLAAATPAPGQEHGPHFGYQGRYRIRFPGEEKSRLYTRVTTWIKALDDSEGLIPWKATAAIVGMLRRPGLHARWSALVAEHPDPWYATDDSKREAKRLVEECAEAGGSSDRSDLGTGLHRMVHVVNRGMRPQLQPPYAADIDAYLAALDRAGLWIDPAWCEVTLWMPDLGDSGIVGTTDALGRLPFRPLHLGVDIKTGDRLKPLAFAAQLACYARATHGIRWAPNPEDEVELVPVPPIDQELGVIVHLPAGQGRCELHLVDLTLGGEALRVVAEVRRFRALGRTGDELMRPHVTVEALTAAPMPEPPAPEPDTSGPCDPEVLEWLRRRARALIEQHRAAAVDLLNGLRSAGLPTPKEGGHTAAQLAAVEALLVKVEADHGVPFGEPKPGTVPTPPAPAPGPGPAEPPVVGWVPWMPPDEGGPENDDVIDALARDLRALSKDEQRLAQQIAREAAEAGRPIVVTRERTRRRAAIVRGIITAARAVGGDLDAFRGLVVVAVNGALEINTLPAGLAPLSTGALVAGMTIDEAHRLEAAANAVEAGELGLRFADDSTAYFVRV